ncbi:flagellar basal body P-ring protein FlgI [Vibrio sp. PNB22_3_1]
MKRFDKSLKSLCHLFIVFAVLISSALAVKTSSAATVGEIVDVYGDRTNQLVGYGLVIGLDGTGDKSQVRFTQQSVKNMIEQFGVQLSGGTDPKLKNVASVIVTSTMTPHHSPGQKIDLTVSSIGDASSLVGGTLLLTQLKGIDGEVYAVGQGNLVVGGYTAAGDDGSSVTKNVPTVGVVPNGALIEKSIESRDSTDIVLNLKKPNYETAINISNRINKMFGDGVAQAVTKGRVVVTAPRKAETRVAFTSMITDLEVEVGESLPQVVFNARTGTIVISDGVRVSKAAVSKGGLVVKVGEDKQVVQPLPLTLAEAEVVPVSQVEVEELTSGMKIWGDAVDLQSIVDMVNAVGASPETLMQILVALDEAGALHGELVVI